jgi:FtsZ-binding cell division protein ZapB
METDGKWSMSMGFGNYRNANAVAVGTFYRPTDNLQFSLGGTLGNGENMISAGMSIALDRNPAVTGMTKAAMAREIRSLKQDNKAKDAQVKDLQSQVDTLKKENEDTKAKLAMIMAKLGM